MDPSHPATDRPCPADAVGAGDREWSLPERAPASDRGSTTMGYALRTARGWNEHVLCVSVDLRSGPVRPTALTVGRDGSALALLVARVGADDHDPAVPANDPALVADPLDARLDLHGCLTSHLAR